VFGFPVAGFLKLERSTAPAKLALDRKSAKATNSLR